MRSASKRCKARARSIRLSLVDTSNSISRERSRKVARCSAKRTQIATSAWLAKQMLKEAGHNLPVVTTLHGTDITIVGQDHSYHAITKFSIEKSDRVTAVSQYLKDETVRAFGCDNRRVEVIPNFVDPAAFDRQAYDGALSRQLGDGRNSGWTQEQVEAEFARTLGTDRVIWFDRGLHRDYDDFGTRGHVDIVACFSDPTTVLVHDQRNPEHPDFAVTAEVREILAGYPDLTVIDVPAPDVLRDDEGWVDYSYINHLIVNGGIILCAFDDAGDERAAEILRAAYPGREIVLVDARPLFARGGGIHCITQQQPRSGRA